MQAIQNSMQSVNNKPTDAQIQQQLQSQIQNLRWSEKQDEIQAAWNRQMQTQQVVIAHRQFVVDHLADPLMIVCVVAIIAFTVGYLVRRGIAADIEKNRDDNAGDVREAQNLLEKTGTLASILRIVQSIEEKLDEDDEEPAA